MEQVVNGRSGGPSVTRGLRKSRASWQGGSPRGLSGAGVGDGEEVGRQDLVRGPSSRGIGLTVAEESPACGQLYALGRRAELQAGASALACEAMEPRLNGGTALLGRSRGREGVWRQT